MKGKTIGKVSMVLSLLFSGIILMAQNVDHIYLKNGSVIRGSIEEIDPEAHVKIQDLCGNIWFYKMTEVEKITSEPYSPKRNRKEDLSFGHGYVNMTSMGFLAGSSNNAQVAPFSLLMVNGWKNSLGLFTGLGVGVEFLTTNYIPLFVDLRYDLIKGDVVPYVVAKGGYSLPMASSQSQYDNSYEYEGGPLAGFGLGLKIKSRTHFAWDITLMYRYQKTSYSETYDWNNQVYNYSDVYNRLEIRLGFYID